MLSSSLRRACIVGIDASVSQLRCASTAAVTRTESSKFGDDVKRIQSTGRSLINGAKQASSANWRHTNGKMDERERMKQDLLTRKEPILHDGRSQTATFGGFTLDDWTIEDLLQSGTAVLQPGAFFEIRRNAIAVTGIVLSSASTIGYNEDTMSLDCRGESILHRTTDVMFAIPNFVDKYLIERCGKERYHEDQHQLAARLRVLKAIREFERSVEKEQYRIGRAIRELYPKVCASNPDEWGKVTTMQVARMIERTPNVPIATLFAVHRQLMDHADEFVCHPSRHRFVHAFDVRPLSHVRNIQTVKQFIRHKNPVIRSFQEKAKLLIDKSRDLAKQSFGEPPSRAEIVNSKFTNEGQEIITFLKLSMTHGRRIQEDSYAGIIPAIIKDTYKYDELITSYVTLKFLREIGVYTPWEDMGSKDKDLYLPEVTAKEARAAMTASGRRKEAVPQVMTPGLIDTDSLESVRHDFGDLPVYVIDDLSAEELDDGISVEAVPGESDTAWLHVHVADPTVVIPVTHSLVPEILKRSESLYFGHNTWPMLPSDVSRKCDMGRRGVRKHGQRVLTFSAKIGPDGSILDYKVRAGRVRNVHKLTYDDVNAVLLPEDHRGLGQFHPFEPENAIVSESRDVSHVVPLLKDLNLAYDVSRRLLNERLRRNTFNYVMNDGEVTFVDKPALQNPSFVERPILYRGYPKLRYTVTQLDTSEVGSRSLVAEFMKAACRVASRFCSEHNLPAIRRAMGNVQLTDATLSRILPERDELGFVAPQILAREGIMLPPSELTLEPAGHWALGVPEGEGYVRATSPLRRAEDILMHWQVKSALLPEGGALAPFDEGKMSRILEELNGRKLVLKKAYRAHKRQWTHTYIQRFMEEQERNGTALADTNPLRGMEGYIMQSAVHNVVRWLYYQDVFIPKLGLTAVVQVKSDSELPVGERVKVNAASIFQYDLNQTLEVTLA